MTISNIENIIYPRCPNCKAISPIPLSVIKNIAHRCFICNEYSHSSRWLRNKTEPSPTITISSLPTLISYRSPWSTTAVKMFNRIIKLVDPYNIKDEMTIDQTNLMNLVNLLTDKFHVDHIPFILNTYLYNNNLLMMQINDVFYPVRLKDILYLYIIQPNYNLRAHMDVVDTNYPNMFIHRTVFYLKIIPLHVVLDEHVLDIDDDTLKLYNLF